MATFTITYRHRVDGVLTDATSVVLSDPASAYGVKRNDTDAVVVADGTAMTKTATGTYQYTVTAPALDLTFTAYIEKVYDGITNYVGPAVITGPTTATSTSTELWSVNSLANHIRGEMDLDDNAAGGTVPARLKNIVREVGMSLWRKYDWQFKLKQGTLTLAPGASTADVPSDFHELSQRWVLDTQSSSSWSGMRFTMDPAYFQETADSLSSTAETEPRLAMVVTKAGSTFAQQFIVTPAAGAGVSGSGFSYTYWYTVLDPWTASSLSDDASPAWPATFNEGWHLLALARVQRAFKQEGWEETYAAYKDWLKDTIADNNETLNSGFLEPIRDGYGDMDYLASNDPNTAWLG